MEKAPVCGMEVDPTKTTLKHERNGTTYYFCSEACRDTFIAEPEKYAA